MEEITPGLAEALTELNRAATTAAQQEYERLRIAMAGKQLEVDARTAARNADLESVGTEMNRLLREQARIQRSKIASRARGGS